MQTTTNTSNQIFNVGDYVKTSKNNLGVIQSSACLEVGYYKDGWVKLEKFYTDQILEANDAIDKWSWYYPNTCIVKILTANLVKIGKKEYFIQSDKLKKLAFLSIRTQQGLSQQLIKLPVNDAKSITDIYTRNSIWFNLEW